MIPFTRISKTNKKRCHFFHANGYPPEAYTSLLNMLSNDYDIQSMLLRPFWEDNSSPKNIKNWDTFLDDVMKYTKENNIYNENAIGHSIGGNLLFRSALENKNLYKSIVLLDPTIFSPLVIYAWKLISYLRLHPLTKNARNRRRKFDNFNDIFNSYRSKNIFSNIHDTQLNEYIYSIFKENGNHIELSYDSEWEEIMYLTAGVKDFDIWKNLNELQTPTLIIIPDKNPVLRYFASKKISKNKFITIKTLKDSTHLFPLENPKETSKIILDFF